MFAAGILEAQPSETPPLPFSFMNAHAGVAMADKLISCAKTHTNEETHRCVTAIKPTLVFTLRDREPTTTIQEEVIRLF